MNLSQEQKRMLREVVVFYRHHHMSASNPQQKDIDIILDTIQKDINSPITGDGINSSGRNSSHDRSERSD
jgi:hypothetical protein